MQRRRAGAPPAAGLPAGGTLGGCGPGDGQRTDVPGQPRPDGRDAWAGTAGRTGRRLDVRHPGWGIGL